MPKATQRGCVLVLKQPNARIPKLNTSRAPDGHWPTVMRAPAFGSIMQKANVIFMNNLLFDDISTGGPISAALHSTPLHSAFEHSSPLHSIEACAPLLHAGAGTRLNGDMAELLQSTISFGAIVITTAPLSSRRPGADAWSQQRALTLVDDFLFPENSFSWCAAPAKGYVHSLIAPRGY